ncbi:hypothetical protein Rcae01_00381 [Novipirellula caenicola]|uniref:Uncharacterized protein n=1 Tax=Novipirellula caenicola TaxID=1536901 RepID=A0ABP9VIA7_9BACT
MGECTSTKPAQKCCEFNFCRKAVLNKLDAFCKFINVIKFPIHRLSDTNESVPRVCPIKRTGFNRRYVLRCHEFMQSSGGSSRLSNDIK